MSWGDLIYHLVFYAFAILTVGSAFVVAQSTNILHSAFALLMTFFGVAGLYAFLGADFLAAAQLVIYVGGILILLIFAVMLTHKIKQAEVSNETASWPLGLLIAAVLYFGLAYVALRNEWYQPAGGPPATASEVATGSSTAALGNAFLGKYLLPFELASVALLAALVAAAHLARKEEPMSEEEFDRVLAASEPPPPPPEEESQGGGHDDHGHGHDDSAAPAHGGGHGDH